MTYHVNLIGLIYFHVCETSGELSAFFPDGRNPGGGIPPHLASLFIEVKDHDSDDWWSGYKRLRTLELKPTPGTTLDVDVFEFEVPEQATITFSNNDQNPDPADLKNSLPRVLQLDSNFVFDPQGEIIAKVPLTGGTLQTQNFEGAAIVRWTITTHASPITITAHTSSGTSSDTRRITLKPSTTPLEIVFSNTSDLIKEGRDKIAVRARAAADAGGSNGPAGAVGGAVTRDVVTSSSANAKEDDHSSIFGKLNKNRDGKGIAAAKFPDFKNLPTALSTHAYLNFLRRGKELPLPKCSPICCS
jgi:hypothetical protein